MIKMLTGMAADDFALAPNENTDRFSDAEEKRFIDAGIAEAVQAEVVKKKVKK
jgi:hypothetical protein